MPRFPFLTLTFPAPFTPADIEPLRHALITAAFRHQHHLARHYLHPDLFTNEDTAGKSYDRYPLIQYKILGGRAAVLGLAQGAKALALLWEKWEDGLPGGERGRELNLARTGATVLWKETAVRATKKQCRYRLERWMPCNKDDAPVYQKLTAEADKAAFLRAKLAVHLQKMSAALSPGLPLVEIPELRILAETDAIFRSPHPRPLLDCTFTAALRLPDGLGLGNSPAFGFGLCRREE